MKIGYIVANFPVLSETFVVNDMRGLEALGHEVVAVALGGADPATEGNENYRIEGRTIRVKGLRPPVWRKAQKLLARRRLEHKYEGQFAARYWRRPADVPDDLWRDRLTLDAAIEQIDREDVDFLYVHFATRQLLLGYHASRLLHKPLAVTLQAHDIFTNSLSRLFPQLLGQCAFVVTVSHYNREEILKLAPELEARNVHVLANGIDVAKFRPRFHPPQNPFRFAATGRLVEIKGFHVLAEAAGILARRRRDFSVQIVGEGPMRPLLERRREALGIEAQFQLLGARDASFLHRWLPEQDCFVLPCVIARDGNRDGMPLALREGMACGLPAISTQLLGLHETVSEGTGMLVPADNPAALADAMESMMTMPPEAHRVMAEAARAKAEGEFSLRHEVMMLSQWMAEEVRRRREAAASEQRQAHGRRECLPNR